MAAEEGDIVRGIYTGEEQLEELEDEDGEVWEFILLNVTHVTVHDSVTVIPGYALFFHPKIVELICHLRVIKIEEYAFDQCRRLKRLIMPGVEEVEERAFHCCEAIEHIECHKLEIIRMYAFSGCDSLSSIDLLSARILEDEAFEGCRVLRGVKFGKNLDRLGAATFRNCSNLERITIPLKEGLIGKDDVFTECNNLEKVDLVEHEVLHETVAALLMEEWRRDMSNVIYSINHILPNTPAGHYDYFGDSEVGGKAIAIQEWIALVLRKIILYKEEHRSVLNEFATILQLNLPIDIVQNHVLAFLELPLYAFDGEDDGRMVESQL